MNDPFSEVKNMAGASSLLYITIVLVCIALAWWALQAFRLDVFMRQPKSAQAKLLQMMLAVALGYGIAKFIIDYLQWSMLLKGIFS